MACLPRFVRPPLQVQLNKESRASTELLPPRTSNKVLAGEPAMNSTRPHLSIGVPVHNGALFLRQALESLMAQTYEDFELIIADNASTDETESICQSFAAQDRRVRYHRSNKNLGAARN